MADGDGLAGGSGSRHCGGSLSIIDAHATCKPTTNLLGRVQLSPGERAGPGNKSPRTVIIWSLSLKQPENPLCAIGGPGSDKASVGFV